MTPHNLKLPPKYSGNEPMHGNLMQDGFCILPGAVPTELMAAIEVDLAPRFAVTATEENGATLIWPGSHGKRALTDAGESPMIVAEAEPDDAIVFLGTPLHGAGGNRSAGVRRSIVVSYSLGWLKPYENQWLAYPPHVAREFPRELSELVGYAQHRSNLGSFEGQCPSVLFDGDSDAAIAAIDALRPDQAVMLEVHVAAQRGAGGVRGEES